MDVYWREHTGVESHPRELVFIEENDFECLIRVAGLMASLMAVS